MVTITVSGKLSGGGASGACKRCALIRDTDDRGGGDVGLDSVGFSEEKCWHSGWAEIRVRRSSGNTGWMMYLQNRLQPLSLTHPSTHGIPESELSLLATSISPEEGKAAEDGAGGQESNEEIFLSREVGSFTDISFLSKAPRSIVAEVHSHVTSHVTQREEVEGVRDSESKEDGAFLEDGKDEGDQEVPVQGMEDITEKDGSSANSDEERGTEYTTGDSEVKTCEGYEEASAENRQSKDEKSTSDEATTPGMLSISETAALLQDDALEGKDSHPQIDEIDEGKEPEVSKQDTSVQDMPPHVKRSANSHSWSATEGMTSPLPITPRPSSYTFSMEYLPPLLSYDGGEGPSHSPSLHDEGKVMSEEEQVCGEM